MHMFDVLLDLRAPQFQCKAAPKSNYCAHNEDF